MIKKKVFLEDLVSRNSDITYGTITATTIYMKVFLTQTLDNMGVFTDYPFHNETPIDYDELTDKLNELGLNFEFMNGSLTPINSNPINIPYNRLDLTPITQYYVDGQILRFFSESRLETLKTYSLTTPYQINFDIESGNYVNYNGQMIDGRTRVTQLISDPVTGFTGYSIDGNFDSNLGSENQVTGFYFKDFNSINTIGNYEVYGVNLGETLENIKLSEMQFKSEGFNNTNSSLSAITKEEYLMNIIDEPKVNNDVFIERGNTSVMDRHIRLSEIDTMEDLELYGNGYFNIEKQ